ncbi:MAG TPA: GAF domain-containing protein, partial [Aggregatilineales bacterium]|nr:GAF domain-containing protein [Aggregatilineales bacterium]
MGTLSGILILLFVGLSLFVAVGLWASFRREGARYSETHPESVVPVNLLDNNNAVVVAEGRGHLIFANSKARQWFGMNGTEPDLELMAHSVQPPETFLELFGKEGQASFRIGTRRVEATSHYIPRPDGAQTVVVMRELAAPDFDKLALDPIQAMNVVSEITQTISGSLNLNETLASILNSLGSVIKFDIGEVTLWDEDLRILRPIGQSGEVTYIDRFNSTDGVYHLDDSYSGWIARYRQPLLMTDVAARPDVKPKLKDYPIVSFIGIPLNVGDRFIGTLELASRRLAAFDHEDMTLLQAIAGQAAIAIENARLYQSQSERLTELSGLQQIVSAMTSLADPRQMYHQLTSRIAGLMNVEMCGILLYDGERGTLTSQPPFFGVPDAITTMYRIPVPEGSVALAVFKTHDWWYTNNVKGDDLVRQLGLVNLADAVGVKSTALAPMLVGTRRLGVVQTANKRDGSGFSENDVRLLSIFASQAAIVVENARLYDEEQRRADELGGLQQISQAIGVLRDVNELYGQINERIGILMNVQMCGILLYDQSTDQFSGRAPFYGVDSDVVRYYQIRVGDVGLMHDLNTTREFWLSNEPRTDADARACGFDKLATLIGVRQTILVPLIVGGQRLGLVQIANKLTGGEFTESDARILSIFASQAAVIIDNSRLYHEMQERATESEGLRRIAEAASSNLPLETIVAHSVGDTAKLMASEVVAVGLLNEKTGSLTIRPEWTSGMESLTQPFSVDVYAPEFQNSVLISKRLLLANDLRNDGRVLPVYRAMGDRFSFDAMIQVPLIVRDLGIGELIVGRRTDRDFNNHDVQLAQAIAIQLAAAVERAELYESTDANLRARIQELDALTHVSNELNLTLDLERIIDVICSEATRTTGADGATLALLKSDGTIETRFGTFPDGYILAPIEKNAIDHQSALLIPDYTTAEALEASPKTALSAAVVPIKYAESMSGVLHVYSRQTSAFTLQTLDFLRALSDQAGIAIGNANRNKEQIERSELLRQRADQLNQIFELGRTLRSGDKLENVLDAVAEGVTATVNFNRVRIGRPDGETWRWVASAGVPRADLTAHALIPRAEIEAKLLPKFQIGESYFVPADSSSSARDWQPGDLLYVPLRSASGEPIGVMQVDGPRDRKRPSQQTIEALEIFANQAAFAIENFRLVSAYQTEVESTRRERDRLAQLHLVASEIQRAIDIPTRLQVVADGIRSAGWGRVAITLRDQNYEPRETITSGYGEEGLRRYKEHLLPGIVWQQRLADPDFRRFRVGQAYYLRHSDQWVTENKLIAGANLDEAPTDPTVWHPQDTVYLPLYGLDRSRLIGVISMDSPVDGKPPTETGMRPIELFAVQASSAIENTRLYEETIRAAQQEARINEVMETVSSTLDLNQIILAVARGLQQMIAFTRMTVALYDERRGLFDIQKVESDPRDALTVADGGTIPAENTAVGAMLTNPIPRVYHYADIDRIPAWVDLNEWHNSGERTTMVVPMVTGGHVLGVLHMGSELVHAFGFDEQLSLVSRLGNLTAIAIENARLFQQAVDRERFSASLRRVGESLNAMLDMTGVLNTVCDESRNILGVAGAYITLRRANELVGIAARGQSENLFVSLRQPLESPRLLSNAVIRQKVPIFINDLSPDSPFDPVVRDEPPVRAMLGVPLVHENEATGALIVTQTDPNKPFTEDDIEKASTLAFQASIAIENARLYQETLGLQSFNEAVVQSIQQGIVVLNRDLRIRTINSFMVQHYDWDKSGIGLALFDYRSPLRDLLSGPIDRVLANGQPESIYGVRQAGPKGNEFVRNFYVYPLLEGQIANGIVLLVEDVTEQAKLEADIQERAEQLSVLTEVSGKLTATLEPNAVVGLLLDELDRILDYDTAALWERAADKLVIRAVRGYANADQLIGVEAEIADSDLFREIASRGQVLNIPDITQDPRFPMSELRPVRSWLGVSLVSKGNLAGLLVLEKEQVAYYTPTMEQLALTYANQAAIALENARLYQDASASAARTSELYQEAAARAHILDQQTQRFALLNRVATALAQSLDIENVFEVTLRETLELLSGDLGGAAMFEWEQNRGRVIMEYPRRDQPPGDTYFGLDNPLMETMRATHQPVYILDVLNDQRKSHARELMANQEITSILLIPLNVAGQVIGSLGYSTIGRAREFTPEQIDLAQTIASQAAVAVQNANLYEQSVVRTRELETLFEATQSISTTLDLKEVISKTARQITVALMADRALISTWDNVENRLIMELDHGETMPSIDAAGTVWNLSDYPVRERALLARQAILVRQDDPRLDANEKILLEQRQVTSRLILPMVVREQSIGLIELESSDPGREFSASDVRLARTLASQAAISIDNARLQNETASKLEELFVINELSTALSSSIELDQVFTVVREQVPGLVKAQSLIMAVLSEDGVTLSYPVALK